MKIDLNSKLIPNVQIYVVNGNWSGVIVEDCMTDELLFHIFGQGPTKSTTRRIDRDQTFNDMFPDYDLSFSKPSLKISSLPFTFGTYASDGKSIYQIVYKEGHHLVTLAPLEEVEVFVKDLLTDEVSAKKVSELSIHKLTDQFYKDLADLSESEDDGIRSYLKAAHEYSDFFRNLIEASKVITSLDSTEKFKTFLEEFFDGKKFNTRGKYFVNGDDIQYYTFLEDDKVVVLKTRHSTCFDEHSVVLLSRTEYAIEDFKESIGELVRTYEISMADAIELFNESWTSLRTRYYRPYLEEYDLLKISE